MKILITGTAGFIGFHLANRLVEEGYEVTGLDNINDYYDPGLKYARLAEAGVRKQDVAWGEIAESKTHPSYRFIRMHLEDTEGMERIFGEGQFDVVVHLAAQAGVRYSLTNPRTYIDSNIVGFLNVLEGCRHNGVGHLVYASSSSVYGMNEKMPLSESDNVDHPVSLYAVTKKSNELMAHAYSHLYGIPATGLRFFTAYGPWGRPDMALYLFTMAMMRNEPIDVFNRGDMVRDFTYIDDVVEGVCRILHQPARPSPGWSGEEPDPSRSSAPYHVYNIGNSDPVRLMDFIEALEEVLGRKAEKNMLPMQPGDVPKTYADVTSLQHDFDYRPETPVKEGIRRFVEWVREWEEISLRL